MHEVAKVIKVFYFVKKFTILLFIFSVGEVSKAQISCRSILTDSNKTTLRSEMLMASELVKQGNYDEALYHLNIILEIQPKDYRALALKSHVFFRLKRVEEALVFQLESMQSEPAYREASYMSLANIYVALNQPDEALTALNEVLRNNPNHTQALGLKARMHLLINELEEAYNAISLKFDIDEKDTYALSLLVEYYYKKSDFPAALKIANRLVTSHKPKKYQRRAPKAYLVGLALRAKVYTAINGHLKNALDDLETLNGYFERLFPWLIKLKAEALYKSGKIIEAQRVLKSLVEISDQVDLSVAAALVRIEQTGESDGQNAFLSLMFSRFSDEEVRLTMLLSRQLDWDYFPKGESAPGVKSMINTFWSSLYSMPVNSYTRKSTF